MNHNADDDWDKTMDVNDRIRAAKEATERREAEAKARREERDRSEAAHHAWQRAAGMTRRCYPMPETIPEAIESIQTAIRASEMAGELALVRKLADFYLLHRERLIVGVEVAATIVNVAEPDTAAQMLRDAIEARFLDSVADAIDGIGEVVWHGHEPEVFYANLFPQESAPPANSSTSDPITAPLIIAPAEPVLPAIHRPQSYVRVDLMQSRIWIGNESYEVKPNGAVLIQALVEADGVPISASEVVDRPTRVMDRLPKEVRILIETVPGKGTCIPREKLFPQ